MTEDEWSYNVYILGHGVGHCYLSAVNCATTATDYLYPTENETDE